MGNSAGGRPGAGQSTGEAEAMKQPEGERDNPGMANRKAGLAAPNPHDLRAEKEDTEGNSDVERYNWGIGITQSSESQSDAVGDGECADSLNQHPTVLHD